LHAMDWTLRYLEGGPKVYAFHTVTIPARAIHSVRNVGGTTTRWLYGYKNG